MAEKRRALGRPLAKHREREEESARLRQEHEARKVNIARFLEGRRAFEARQDARSARRWEEE